MPITRRGSNPAKPFIADYLDRDGTRHQVPCATVTEARVLILADGGPKSGRDVKEATVEELFEYVWVAREAKPRPGAVHTSRLQARLHLLPLIGHVRVDKLDKGHFAAILANMQGLAEATVGTLITYLVTNLDIAVYRGIVRKNLARAAYDTVRRSAPTETPAVPLASHVEELHEASNGWPRVQLALYTEAALTPPEAAGLQWSCVDLEARTLNVAHRMLKHLVVPLTGDRLARTVPMTPMLFDVLSDWRGDPASGPHVVLHPRGCMRAWTSLCLPLVLLQLEKGMVAPEWQPAAAWSTIEGKSPLYAHMQFRLVAAARWHREGHSIKELAALMGLKSTRTLIPIVRALVDDQDLHFIGTVDAAIRGLLPAGGQTSNRE